MAARPASVYTPNMRGFPILLVLLSACPGKVPDHLRPPEATVDADPFSDVENTGDLIAALVGADPLARSPRPGAIDAAQRLEGGAPYVSLLEASQELGPESSDRAAGLRALEAGHRGTSIVALSRGARLQAAEAALAQAQGVDLARELVAVSLVTGLVSGAPDDSLPLRPLDWLSRDAHRDALLTLGDRWVLTGWMDGPAIDLEPVDAAMNTAPYDALRRTPMGRLVLARAGGVEGPFASGLEALEAATRMQLELAVADSNREQAALAKRRTALREELGGDPVVVWLQGAASELTDAAGEPHAAGGALLAIHALRLVDTCEDTPCVGLDRVRSIHTAGRWHPDLARLSRLWQIAALAEAIDGVEVARGTVRYPRAMVDLIDALAGTGVSGLDARLLRQRSPDPATWLSIVRALGEEQGTTWEEARLALIRHLRPLVQQALSDEEDPDVRALLERLSSRLGAD